MTQRAGVVDLGSNTTRLVIYEYEPGKRFRLADEVREVVRLREGMGNSNVLRAAAIERSLNALRMFRRLCDAMDVQDTTVVATSAVRDAANSDSFLGRATADTGWTLRILSGEEEGYYGALGAINATGLRQGFVIDLGGGSAQVVEIRAGVPRRSVSMPLGALRLTEMFVGSRKVQVARVEALRAFVREQLEPLTWFKAGYEDSLVAIGGTIRNITQVDQAGKGYPLDSVQGYELAAIDLHDISERLWPLTVKKRSAIRGLRYDRADIIHAGALAYSEISRFSGFDSITISRQGLREGVFYERFLDDQTEPTISNLRQFSVMNLARNFNCDDMHSRHVADLALSMFDQLQPAHQLDSGYRGILWAAAMLHDIGTIVDYQYHHHHSYYIVLNHTLPGYTPRELALIALLCRYHRSKGKPKTKPLTSLVVESDTEALVVLAGILRLAEFFERGRHQVIRDLRCHLDLEQGWVQIEALAQGDAAMELWDAGRNLDVLGQALGLEVELVEGMWLANSSASA
ncbi:MAG: Ppx/GppA family phosphatase [Chloroflexi bacterium]|nr:Ppx/GppA family phosphatase [Chloroflexota bacterium]